MGSSANKPTKPHSPLLKKNAKINFDSKEVQIMPITFSQFVLLTPTPKFRYHRLPWRAI